MKAAAPIIAWIIVPGLGMALAYYLRRRSLISARIMIAIGGVMGAAMAVFVGIGDGVSAGAIVAGGLVFGVGLASFMAVLFALMKRSGSNIPW